MANLCILRRRGAPAAGHTPLLPNPALFYSALLLLVTPRVPPNSSGGLFPFHFSEPPTHGSARPCSGLHQATPSVSDQTSVASQPPPTRSITRSSHGPRPDSQPHSQTNSVFTVLPGAATPGRALASSPRSCPLLLPAYWSRRRKACARSFCSCWILCTNVEIGASLYEGVGP